MTAWEKEDGIDVFNSYYGILHISNHGWPDDLFVYMVRSHICSLFRDSSFIGLLTAIVHNGIGQIYCC